MRRFLFVLLQSGATAGAACGLTADFEGLQRGAREAGAIEVGTVGKFDAAANGGVDAGPIGAVDAASDGAGFCASRTRVSKLCADFDESLDAGRGWDSTEISRNGVVRVDEVAFSPPGSLGSAISPGEGNASARLIHVAPTSVAHVHAEFRLLLEPNDTDSELFVFHEVTPDGTSYGVFYKEAQRNVLLYVKALRDDGGLTEFTKFIGVPPATWMGVEIDFDVADDATVTVKHDGAIVLSERLPTSTRTRTSVQLALGLHGTVQKTARARFDDVVFDWK